MRAKFYLLYILSVFYTGFVYSQTQKTRLGANDTAFFNYAYWSGIADKKHFSPSEKAEWIEGQKRIFLEERSHKHVDPKDYIWVSEAPTPAAGKGYGQNTTNAGPCTNIDFESGTFAGWTRSTGYNPLTNATGCCPSPNGDQTIMTGAGTDPFGGFPVVYPGGGSFSLRLGSTATGGIADRISQTFFVTAANANFTYRYAVVLNDPNHALSQQPYFTSEIIDTLGNPIVCTTYSVAASGGIPGFTTSATTANGGAVRCKNWTNVAVDLSPNIGQNVTIRFTVYDCGPSGHFAYAYLDGLCTNFATSVADTTCPNVPLSMCAPSGFSTTTWNGPGVVNDPNQCINAVIPGTYTCTTLLIPGCPGPTFTHTLTVRPSPLLSISPNVIGPCSPHYTFYNSSSIPAPNTIVSYKWNFGDGVTTNSTVPFTPTHTYAAPGTYPVTFKVTTGMGCVDSVRIFVTIFPSPNLSFSPPSHCINTVIQFTNTSTIAAGTISTYTWNFFGNGPNSNLVNPTNTYSANGTYSITLSATSSQGCVSSLTQTLGIFPPPVISFSAANLCDANGTSFAPSTSTAIASGSLNTFFWDFGDGGTSTAANPVHIYTTTGVYTVSFTAISNHNCSASVSNSFAIFPSPNVAFNTTSVNACSNNFTFTNNSNIVSGSVNYVWSFNGTTTTSASNPTFTFPGIGNHTVMLLGTSNLGCTDTAFNFISIYPLPIINFSVPAACENAVITVSTTAVSGSVTSYNWNFGDPSSGAANTSTLQNPTHYFGSTGNYSVTLNIVSNLNCPSTSSISVLINPNPVAAFTFSTLNNCSLPYTFTSNSTVSSIGASSVTGFNWNFGAAGTSTLQNPGSINFPANGTYTVSLIATTNHNCSDTAISTVVIHPFPQVNFSVNATCLNVPVTYTSSSFISPIPSAGSSINTYTWNYGDNTFSNTATSPPHTYSASGIYTVFYGGTSNMGCTSSVTKTVQIWPAPVVNFTTSGSLCYGNLTQFTSTNTISSGTLFAYNWDFGDGTFGSNPITTHSYNVSGNYPVTYSVTSNNECMTIVRDTVRIRPLPAISYTANGGCLNTLSSFATTSTISAGSITSYSWNFGDNSGSTFQNPTHTYTLHGTYTPTLVATSNYSCTSSAIQTVVIHPLPNISFSPPGACVNSVIQFTNTSSIPLGTITSFVWNFSDGTPTTTILNPIHTFTTFGTYSVVVTAVSNQNCVRSSTNNVTIYPYPQVTVTPLANTCINDNAQINLNITIPGSGNPVNSYSVGFGDGSPTFTNSGVTNTTIPHVYVGYNTYTITARAVSNGCIKDTTALIKVYPKPFANFVSSKYCMGDTTVFVNTSTIAATYSITNHYWNFNNGVDTSATKNPKHAYSGAGTYPVKLIEYSYPEPGVTCKDSVIKNLTINPLPGAGFNANTVCSGSPTSFTNTSPSPTASTAWSWYFYNNGQLNSVALNPSYTYTSSSGTYTFNAKLKAQNSFGCRDSIVKMVQLYVNPTPSFVPTDACLNQANLFPSGTSSLGTGNIPSYSWNFATFGSTNVPNPSFTFPNPGTFTVQLTITDELGCSGKYTTSVTVNPLPIVSFTSNEACFKSMSQFVNLSSGTITSYSWNFGDPGSGAANTSTVYNPSHFYSNTGVFTATLTATTDKSCTDSYAKTITIHGPPLADFTNTLICVGDNLTFANTSSISDGTISSSQWDFNGDNLIDQITTTTSPTYSYATYGNYTVKLIVTSQYGCSDDTVKQVYANPKAVAAITSDSKAGCPSLCINFKDASSIASGSFTTTWDYGDGSPTATVKNTSHCYNSGNYDVSLTLVSDVGCTTRFKHPSYVSVFPLPTAGFDVSPEQVDEDEPVISVTNNSSADAEFVKYYINDGSSFGTNNFTHYIKNLKQTKPMVVQIVKNKYGCADTLFKVLDIKPAYVIYFPDVFTPNGDGVNDSFMPKGVGIIKFSMQIFDRWGHQVFKTNDMADTWDGSSKGDDSIKQDVYTWKAQVTDVFNKNHFLVGHVSLIK